MEKLPLTIFVMIIAVAACFFLFNNTNGINDGINDGGATVNTKVSGLDYEGSVGPGAGQTSP